MAGSDDWPSVSSAHVMSRPSTIGTSPIVRWPTTTVVTVEHDSKRFVDVGLQGDRLAAPPALVLGDQHLALHVVDPPCERVRGEAPKTTVCGAPSRAQASMATGRPGPMPM